MKFLSMNELAILCDCDARTAKKRLEGLPSKAGPKNSIQYESRPALSRVLGVNESGDPDNISVSQSQKLLSLAKVATLEVQRDILREKRIPIEDVSAINERIFSNVAGILKSYRGKVMSDDCLNDCFTELRSAGTELKI